MDHAISFLVGALVGIVGTLVSVFEVEPFRELRQAIVDAATKLATHRGTLTATAVITDDEEAARYELRVAADRLYAHASSLHRGWRVAGWFGYPSREDVQGAARSLRELAVTRKPRFTPGASDQAHAEIEQRYQDLLERRVNEARAKLRLE